MNFYENNQNAAILKIIEISTKSPGQIYSKLPKVPFKSFDTQKNVTKKIYTHLFTDLKDLSPMLALLLCSFSKPHPKTTIEW